MEITKINNIGAVISDSLDFWRQYLSILKIFVEPEPSNQFIYNSPALIKQHFQDPIDSSILIEKNINEAFSAIKFQDVIFYNKFHFDVEFRFASMNKTATGIFFNQEISSILEKKMFIVGFLETDLLILEGLIIDMAKNLSEGTANELSNLMKMKWATLTESTLQYSPAYLVTPINVVASGNLNITPEIISKVVQNRAITFLLLKFQNTEFMQDFLGPDQGHLMNQLAKISAGDLSYISQLSKSPKTRETLKSIVISADEEKELFIGNKEFYKIIYACMKSFAPEQAKLERRKIISLVTGNLSVNNIIQSIQIKI